MAKVQINFTALHGAQYTLTIGNPTETATVVDGTRDVFTTTEEDDTDVFMPVRCTSGTVRFYNEGGAWSTLADVSDTHTPVVLSQGSSAVWSGYINKGYVGTRRLYGYNEECEICVQCPLSELDTVDYAPAYTGNDAMHTLGEIITDILTEPFGTGTTIPSSSLPQGGDVGQVLNLKVFMGTFYAIEDSEAGVTTYTPKYTRKEALEKVLLIACCSARWTGTEVRITAPKQETVGTSLTINPADTESNETAVMPYKRIKVTADADDKDTAIEFPTSIVSNWARQPETLNHVQDVLVMIGVGSPRIIGMTWGKIGDGQTWSDAWKNIDDKEYTYPDEPVIAAYQDLKQHTTGDTYNLTSSIWLNQIQLNSDITQDTDFRPGTTTVTPTTFTMSTKAPFFISDAILVLQMRMKLNFFESNFSGLVKFRITIGDQRFNPATQQWVTVSQGSSQGETLPDFIDAEFENGELKRTGNLNNYFDSYQGYGIPVTGTLNGILTIEIKAHPDFNDDMLSVDSFSIKAVRHVSDIREKNTFTATGQNGSSDDSIDLAFCSERRADNADNFLYFSSGVVVNKMIFSIGTMQPEQWVADRRAVMTTGTARSLIILRQNGNIVPGLYGIGSKVYDTLSISHEWAENITEAHLIEVGTSNN